MVQLQRSQMLVSEVDAHGKVTFTPDKQFMGETPELELMHFSTHLLSYHSSERSNTNFNGYLNENQGQPQKGTLILMVVAIHWSGLMIRSQHLRRRSVNENSSRCRWITVINQMACHLLIHKQYVILQIQSQERVDKNEAEVTKTYTPTVTKVTQSHQCNCTVLKTLQLVLQPPRWRSTGLIDETVDNLRRWEQREAYSRSRNLQWLNVTLNRNFSLSR